MYAYACFDLECLYRELAKQPRKEAQQTLLARAEELIDKISHNLRNEVLATENANDPKIVAVADGFAKSMGILCHSLLDPILNI